MSIPIDVLQQWTGIPNQTLWNWSRRGLIEISDDMPSTNKSVCNHLLQMANKKSKHTDDLAGQKVRLAEAQAVKIEGENQLRASELVEAAGVEEAWVKAVSTVEARFLGIPAKLAPMLVNEENPLRIQRLIESEIHQALHELAKNQTQSDHTV